MLTLEPEWIWCATVWARSSVVEHVTFNHGVAGSIPAGPTTRILRFTRGTGVSLW
jgi:hypothetical protein